LRFKLDFRSVGFEVVALSEYGVKRGTSSLGEKYPAQQGVAG
jgi:hypothetical protein